MIIVLNVLAAFRFHFPTKYFFEYVSALYSRVKQRDKQKICVYFNM